MEKRAMLKQFVRSTNRFRLEFNSLGNRLDKFLLPAIVTVAALITLIVAMNPRNYIVTHSAAIVPYWKLFVALLVIFLFLRLWVASARPSVLIMPFDIVTASPPAGLTGIALSRMVFDQISAILDERRSDPASIREIYSYIQEADSHSYEKRKPTRRAAYSDPGLVVTVEYKGISVDLVLSFLRRLHGSLAIVTGELTADGSGNITLRSRCIRPSIFAPSLSSSQRESTSRLSDFSKVRESVGEISAQLAADLRRYACRKMSAKRTGQALLDLGAEYQRLSTGDRSANLLEAIRCYNDALEFLPESHAPEDRAGAFNNRANAFRLMPGPNRIENLTTAVTYFYRAIAYFEKQPHVKPERLAGIVGNLALTYQQLPDSTSTPGRNALAALGNFNKSLDLLSGAKNADWGRISRSKGNFLTFLPGPNRRHNLTEAMKIFESVLDFFQTEIKDTKERAITMTSMGNLKRQLTIPDRNQNLREAIGFYDQALQVYTRNSYPQDWGQIMTQRGNAFREMAGPNRAANLRQAISCFEQVLGVLSRERYPYQWANTMNQKGIALRELPGADRLANLNGAIHCFDQSLQIFVRETYPTEWANAQNLRGTAFSRLPGPDQEANLLEAIRCYELALEVQTREAFPLDWARTYRNRANTFRELPGPDRAANMRKAITLLDEVLEVLTRQHYPEEWATTMLARANVLRDMRVPRNEVADDSFEEDETSSAAEAAPIGAQAV